MTFPITSNSSAKPTSLSRKPDKATETIRRFSHSDNFLRIVNPDTAPSFARNIRQALLGDYPTLDDINLAYGNNFAEQWLLPLIASLVLFTGAKNIDKYQQRQLATIIAADFHYLKVTELLVFFHRFKAGHYERFYGSADPLIVTRSLRTFIRERNQLLAVYEEEERKQQEAEELRRNPPMSRDEWLEIKTIIAMYNPEYTTSQ